MAPKHFFFLTGHADISNPLCITEISFPQILARYKHRLNYWSEIYCFL